MSRRPSAPLRRLAYHAALVFACSCQPPAVEQADVVSLETAAAIGETYVPTRLLEAVRDRAPAEASRDVRAVDELVANSLFAFALHRWDPAAAKELQRLALAHTLTVHLWAEAKAQGGVTDTELQDWTNRHWLSVARPPSARTIHAVVLVDATEEPTRRAKALAVAQRVHAAVVGTTDAEQFEAQARAVPSDGFELKVESLQPVTEDGRIVRLDAPDGQADFGSYEVAFARAANALERPGATSDVIRTSYGYHVLRLLERLPELLVNKSERAHRALSDVLARRARRALEQALVEQANAIPVARERSAEEATGRVRVQE